MSETGAPSDAFGTKASSASVELFDPPMCCSTGLCGPTIDQTLVDVNEMVLTLAGEGVRVERYQMNTHTSAFLGKPDVMRLIQEQKMAALPITVVNGRVVKVGSYPSMVEVRTALKGTQG